MGRMEKMKMQMIAGSTYSAYGSQIVSSWQTPKLASGSSKGASN